MIELLHPLPGATPPSFPVRVAAIDIGSNAIRFVAAEFSGREAFVPLEYIREPVRLGRDAFRSREIGPQVMDAAVEAIARFRKTMDELEVRGYRAVATSAVRDSQNGAELVERVWRECGIRIETITGAEEAHLVWLAVRGRIDFGDSEWVLVDLGGGSVEISLVAGEEVRWSESHPLGTVRLLEELGDLTAESPDRVRRRLEDHAAMLRISAITRQVEATGVVATGGNMEALADLAGSRRDARGVALVRLQTLQAVIDRLATLSPRERMKELGLREDRADVILPAAVVYERIARLLGVHQIVVPYVGVKDGLLLDAVDDLLEHGGHEARLEREAIAGATALARRYDFEAAHAQQVTRLAVALFEQLRELHGLGETERRILIVAALLHDIGQFVSYRRHHKHSYYLIANSELPAFTPRQILLVALVARYHRRGEPQEDHEGYADLPRGDREVVDRLAALLRIADALDREHQQQVSTLTATVRKGEELVLAVEGTGDLLPERWAVQRKAKMCERVFGLRVRFLVPGEADA
jgi:exopolyphosphatase / guanosine-5'-triphosphate,3'-diphosphate pyrophosphatase